MREVAFLLPQALVNYSLLILGCINFLTISLGSSITVLGTTGSINNFIFEQFDTILSRLFSAGPWHCKSIFEIYYMCFAHCTFNRVGRIYDKKKSGYLFSLCGR